MNNVIISGPFGRMGQALCRLAGESESLNLGGGLVSSMGDARADFPLYEHLSDVPDDLKPLVLVDFTEARATMERLGEAADLGIPAVIGTTGFSADQLDEIKSLSKRIPILLSANMSLGINLLLDMVENLARRLDDYDIEIVETHHRLKKDAPSGTALALADSAAKGRDLKLEAVAKHGRDGMAGERTRDEIGIHAVRGGDVVGDHTVLFAGRGERIELTHKASSRDTFALGALFAAEFLADQSPGLYGMNDALSQ